MIWSSGEARHDVDLRGTDAVVDGAVVHVRSERVAAGIYRVTIGERTETLHGVVDGGTLHFFWHGRAYRLWRTTDTATAQVTAAASSIASPMPGRVIEVG